MTDDKVTGTDPEVRVSPLPRLRQKAMQADTGGSYDEQRLLNCFLESVRIDSESRCEGRMAGYCAAALEAAGCTVHFDDSCARTGSDSGNLIAELKGELPGKVYFSAHMDTVTPGVGIDPYIDSEGVIRSRGETVLGGDDKGGVAAIIEMVRVLAAAKRPHPTIGILLTVCEELNLLGALEMDPMDFNGEPCFVLDANGAPGKIIIASPYHCKFTARFFGRAAHAGVEPEKGISAITMAARAVAAMKLGHPTERTTANVGTIEGGTADNVVADSCVITGECRAFTEAERDEVKAQLVQAIEGAVTDEAAHVEVVWEERVQGYEIAQDDPVVQMVLALARRSGLEARTAYSGGCSDANVFAGRGLKSVVLGTGMTDVHGLSESLSLKDLKDITALCIDIAYGSTD